MLSYYREKVCLWIWIKYFEFFADPLFKETRQGMDESLNKVDLDEVGYLEFRLNYELRKKRRQGVGFKGIYIESRT